MSIGIVWKEFTFEEFNRFRAHLSLLHYERSSEQEAKQVLEDIIDLVSDNIYYIKWDYVG